MLISFCLKSNGRNLVVGGTFGWRSEQLEGFVKFLTNFTVLI